MVTGLIAHFFGPEQAAVLVDGSDLRKVTRSWVASRPSDRQQCPHAPPLHLIACPAILVIGALVILAIRWLT